MLTIPISDAAEGMKLAVDVFQPDNPERELLRAGFDLTAPVLTKLRNIGVTMIYVDYPDLTELDQHLLPFLTPARGAVYRQVRNTMQAFERQARPCVSFVEYYFATQTMVSTLMRQGETPLFMDELSGRLGADEVRHSTAVAHLSMVLGIHLRPYLISERFRLPAEHAREVVNLGVGGMLHDIGKAKLSPRLRHFNQVDSPPDTVDQAQWQSHADLGYDMVRQGVEATAAVVVRQHHERYDGSHLPDRQPTDDALRKSHVFSRIVFAANLFDRLRHEPAGRRRANIEILHLMRTKYLAWLDPTILAGLPGAVPPFPPGSLVTLGDGGRAAIVDFNPQQPWQPMLRRFEKDGWRFAGESFAAGRTPDCRIVTVDGVRTADLLPPPAQRKGAPAAV